MKLPAISFICFAVMASLVLLGSVADAADNSSNGKTDSRMKHFSVLINVENLLTKDDNGLFKKGGAYVTRFVTALDSDTARAEAIRLVQSKLSPFANDKSDPPRFLVEKILEVEEIPNTQPGFAFY